MLAEVKRFIEIHQSETTVAGGAHFELTGRNVIACLGGDHALTESYLETELNETLCDPRLKQVKAWSLRDRDFVGTWKIICRLPFFLGPCVSLD